MKTKLNLNDLLNQAILAKTDEQRLEIIENAQKAMQIYLNESPELFKLRFAEMLAQIQQGVEDLKSLTYQQTQQKQLSDSQ